MGAGLAGSHRRALSTEHPVRIAVCMRTRLRASATARVGCQSPAGYGYHAKAIVRLRRSLAIATVRKR